MFAETSIAQSWEGRPAALVIAHPGHELRIHHWLERARPITFVLTDGSGHTDRSRIGATTALLQRVGARLGALYGAISDRQLYEAILAGRRHMFAKLVDDLAFALRREQVAYVVGDAVEGFNPGHDVCRMLLNAAIAQIERTGGRRPVNMEFPVEGAPGACPAEDRAAAITLTLDEPAYRRKIAAVNAYPGLETDVERLMKAHGEAAFRKERIRPVRYGLAIENRFTHPCLYERYGEKRVAAGIYRDVIRYRDHIAPLADFLDSAEGRGS